MRQSPSPITHIAAILCTSSARARDSVQRILQLVLGVLRERRLEHGPAELAEALDRLVGRDLLDSHEQGGRAGLAHVAPLLLDLPVDAGLLHLAEQCAEARAHRHAEHGYEE